MERHRLINNLTATLLIQAFSAVRHLAPDFRLSINFSPSQLHDKQLSSLVELTAELAEFELTRLTIELTETALVEDLSLAGAVAAEFKSLGVRLALDDFGTGYSSMLHLQSLPFDELKVDRSFVGSMVNSRQSRKITAAVVGLGLSLDLKTVAEGIEEQSQVDLLVCQGCHFGQGYFFGRPVPASELAAARSRSYGSSGTGVVLPSVADPLLAFDAHPTERLSQLRAIYDGAPVGLAFLDTDLRYVNLNQRLADVNGRPVQEHLGRKVSDVVPPELYAQFEAPLKRALEGECISGAEIRSAECSLRPRVGMASYQPVRDEAGEILGVCVALADITALKEKEEALRESEDHYRHTVELNPQVPWVTDAHGNNIAVSTKWQTLTGLSPDDTKGYGWMEAVHPDDKQHVLDRMAAALTSGNSMDIEYRVLSGERWVWMRSRGAPRRDTSGKIVRWYGSVESIDEHKRAQDQLRISEARLRAIFVAAPVGLVLVDSVSGRVLNANPRAEELIGSRLEPGVLWKSLEWDAFDPSGRPLDESERPLMRAMNQQISTRGVQARFRRPDGSTRWLSFSAEPVFLDDGKQFGAVLVIQDIHAEKRRSDWLPVSVWPPRFARS
jgi:PAS domain S-box-containing protein